MAQASCEPNAECPNTSRLLHSPQSGWHSNRSPRRIHSMSRSMLMLRYPMPRTPRSRFYDGRFYDKGTFDISEITSKLQ
jgi:hypothetical protein